MSTRFNLLVGFENVKRICFTKNAFSLLIFTLTLSKILDLGPSLFEIFRLKLAQLKKTKFSGAGGEELFFGDYQLPLTRCMFFRESRIPCLNHDVGYCEDKDCLKKNLRDLSTLIRTAQKEVLLSCYTFSLNDLIQPILEAFHRGVSVRVITNYESTSLDSVMLEFRRIGIQTRMTKSSFIFHHKFIILDEKVLINGSANFTDRGILQNTDSLLVTSDQFFIQAYLKEFNYLWRTFNLI